MAKKYFSTLKLRGNSYELAERVPGEPLIEIGYIDIDYSCFKKSKKEKELLKLAKLQNKLDEIRK